LHSNPSVVFPHFPPCWHGCEIHGLYTTTSTYMYIAYNLVLSNCKHIIWYTDSSSNTIYAYYIEIVKNLYRLYLNKSMHWFIFTILHFSNWIFNIQTHTAITPHIHTCTTQPLYLRWWLSMFVYVLAQACRYESDCLCEIISIVIWSHTQ